MDSILFLLLELVHKATWFQSINKKMNSIIQTSQLKSTKIKAIFRITIKIPNYKQSQNQNKIYQVKALINLQNHLNLLLKNHKITKSPTILALIIIKISKIRTKISQIIINKISKKINKIFRIISKISRIIRIFSKTIKSRPKILLTIHLMMMKMKMMRIYSRW